MRKTALFALVCSPLVVSAQVVEETSFGAPLPSIPWGHAVASLGDLDGDGIGELAVASGGSGVFVVFLDADGLLSSFVQIGAGMGGFTGALDPSDSFGASVANLGDRDGDGWPELAVGAPSDDDAATDAGAVWVLHLGGDGSVLSHDKITTGQGGFLAPLQANDKFGAALAAGQDLDADGYGDLAVWSNRSSLQIDRVWLLFLDNGASVLETSLITPGSAGFEGPVASRDQFGAALAMLGDVDGNGYGDLAVGVPGRSVGFSVGGVWVLFLDGQGGVQDETLIRNTVSGQSWPLGEALAPLGDLDGNGTPDFVSSGPAAKDIILLFLDPTAAVVDFARIGVGNSGGFQSVYPTTHTWGDALAFDDIDGDGRGDWVVGSTPSSIAPSPPGQVWILRGSPPPFVQASPQVFAALIPGTAASLTLEGEGYGPESSVSIDGVPVEPARVVVESPTRLRVDLPQLSTLGNHEVSVAPAGGSAPGFDVIEVVAPSAPVLQIGNGNIATANIVLSNEGLVVTAAGPVGQTHYVLFSDVQLPSVVPGLVSLGLGNAFTSLDLAVVLSIPAAGWSQTTLALPNVTALWSFQSVTLDVGRPIPVSNLQQALVIPL